MILLYKRNIIVVKIIYLLCLISVILFIKSNLIKDISSDSSSSPLYSLLKESNKICPQNPTRNNRRIFPVDDILLNLRYSPFHVYHHNGIAYDYYSITDLNHGQAACQWQTWPLPNQKTSKSSITSIEFSPFVISKLEFVEKIYLITDQSLIERHENIRKAFLNQGISFESIEWRIKWNYTTCYSNLTHSDIYQRLNLEDKPLDEGEKRRCSLLMKHVDVWYEMAEQNVGLGLIVEDDAIFVPFFKEKFLRMISAAIHFGMLRLNGKCMESNFESISEREWINQNPMFVIGSCSNFTSEYFQRLKMTSEPMLTTHKSNASRCTHAYLLTSCSAKALIDQIHQQKNPFLPADFFLNSLFNRSLTLQSFWIDPPLVYQGNQVTDLDHLSTFQIQTYLSQSDQ